MKNEVRRMNLTARKKTRNPDNVPQGTPHRTLRFVSLGALFFTAATLLAMPILSLALDSVYTDKILPGVRLGTSMPLDGLTKEDVRTIVNEYQQKINGEGLAYHLDSHTSHILPYPLSLNPDISLQQLPPIITIDADATFDRAYAVGRSETFAQNFRTRLNLLTQDIVVTPVFSINEAALKESIANEFAADQRQTQNAYFSLSTDEKTIEIVPEKEGYMINIETAITETIRQISHFQQPSVELALSASQATVTRYDAAFARDRVHDILAAYPYRLHMKEYVSTPKKDEILRWLTISKKQQNLPQVSLDTEAVEEYLESEIAPAVFIEAQQQKYEIKDGRVVAFQTPRDGRQLDKEMSTHAIEAALLQSTPATDIKLPIKTIAAVSPEIGAETLILKEIIGKGVTDFRGSPTNRRHNISNGMKHINGIIIKDSETFSLVSALGSIDETGGYKPELVIKGTKTIPEYGGGLCQVSTTLFRAVAYSGLPVIERRNHSYRVSYYEPPIGFDATIYSPKPDFRFMNDTGRPILIQARAEGTKAYVDLWGVRDGRRVEVDEPTVFNVRKAPPVRYIETTDLKPGEKKCTERAHDGADAVFERRVYPVDGKMKKDVFKSHYVVWPAVCLVGKKEEKLQDLPVGGIPTESQQSTSTPTATPE